MPTRVQPDQVADNSNAAADWPQRFDLAVGYDVPLVGSCKETPDELARIAIQGINPTAARAKVDRSLMDGRRCVHSAIDLSLPQDLAAGRFASDNGVRIG